jgi:hypothetical protein
MGGDGQDGGLILVCPSTVLINSTRTVGFSTTVLGQIYVVCTFSIAAGLKDAGETQHSD